MGDQALGFATNLSDDVGPSNDLFLACRLCSWTEFALLSSSLPVVIQLAHVFHPFRVFHCAPPKRQKRRSCSCHGSLDVTSEAAVHKLIPLPGPVRTCFSSNLC